MTRLRGLYDLILTESVVRSLAALSPDVADIEALAIDEAPERLVEVLRAQLERILAAMAGDANEKSLAQLSLINALLLDQRDRGQNDASIVDAIASPPRVLRSIRRGGEIVPAFPDTGLATPWLFTADRGSPALLDEIRREAAACDEINILVSFITVSGVRKLQDILGAATAGNAQGVGRTRIRVLTTTYTGATQIAAVDTLARLNGCEVRISHDGRRSRLHAKAWIFQRRTGFGSAYVGSANLSGAALTGGIEWTVKFTERGQAALYSRAKAHFESLWADEEFLPYNPEDAAQRRALIDALQRESGEFSVGTPTYFDLQPKHYQREMLEQLAFEREQGRHRNLLVAATGTGKTVVAALDYRATCARLGHRPRLLFVAHRAQLLRQALRTYREVLRDNSFGELFTGGIQPAQYEYLFASIDSLASKSLVTTLGADYWHTIVIDECHRIAANRFDAFVKQVRPAQLLGLTATPERTDGQSIERYFDSRPDRQPAVELRLWDALDMQLLAPFEYYACDDDTDFSDVPWNQAGEVSALARLVSGNETRARMVLNEWRRLSANPRRDRAIVFCVSVAHARFMSAQFNLAGIPSLCVVGDTPAAEQVRAVRALADGRVSALVTVDLFNEGVDLPNVDTLILLRPTQSALLFQQQIGRGLRLSPGKESCLVLDFVGQHRADFRFDQLLSSITGLTRAALLDAVENGFGSLPIGCHIQLQRQTREQVLRSLRSLTQQSWRRLGAELRSYATLRRDKSVRLSDFLYDQRVSLDEVYRSSTPSGWTSLKYSAGILQGVDGDQESQLSRRFGDLLHVDDPSQLRVMRMVGEQRRAYQPATELDARRAQMLTYQVDSSRGALPFKSFLDRIANSPNCASELVELTDVLAARSRVHERPIPLAEDVPLMLHGAYRVREILTAFGVMTANKRTPFQAGVLGLHDRKTELLFVTLDKSEGFHDRIAYRDYAISPQQFHWQTQNAAGPDTVGGCRYIDSASNGWTFQLFVRVDKSSPYRACGPAHIDGPDDITGDRPMSIVWRLRVPLPSELFRDFSVLRAQG